MGFLSGGISAKRFHIEKSLSEWEDKDWVAKLARRAFGKNPPISAGADEVGWVKAAHINDVSFKSETGVVYDGFVHACLRSDKLKAPAALVKSYQQQEEETLLAAGSKQILSRHERAQAKDTARMRVEEEEKSGAFRRIRSWEVLAFPGGDEVYLGQTGSNASDELCTFFRESFSSSLLPLNLEEIAVRLCESQGWLREYESWTPTRFVDGILPEESPDVIPMDAQVQRFMGREFLTWLLYHIEASEGLIRGPGGEEYEYAIESMIHLDCDWGVGGKVTIRSESPAGARETRAALAAGKQPTRLGLALAKDRTSWRLTLDAPNLSASGLQLPSPSEDLGLEDMALHRFVGIREFWQTLDGLLTTFLHQRLIEDWHTQTRQISDWMIRRAAAPSRGRRASA